MDKREQLKAELIDTLSVARTISAKAEAEGRDFTRSERETVTEAMAKAKRLKDKIGDADMIGAVKDFGKATNCKGETEQKSWGDFVTDAATKMALATGNEKAILSAGSVAVPSVLTDILRRPSNDLSGNRGGASFIQDLLRVRQIEGTDTFGFWRQSVRTFNGRPVAPGTLKPGSDIKIERVEGKTETIAHLSPEIPEQDLADFSDLSSFINMEMRLGLQRAIAKEVLSGDGTSITDANANIVGKHLVGIRSAIGAQVHSRGLDDLMTASRKAKTKMEVIGEISTEGCIFVVHPTDAEGLDLLRDNEGRFYFAGPADGGADRLWKLPVVVTTEQPQGEQLLFDRAAVEVIERESPQIKIGQPGDMFQRNVVQVRAEGRYGLAIQLPLLIVRIVA